jgi:hypothetical protein
MADAAAPPAPEPPALFVVSGGAGASGAQLVRTALAQFGSARLNLVVLPAVRTTAQLAAVLDQADAAGGTIVYTLVDAALRQTLARRARARGIPAVDLMGPLLASLAALLRQEPAGRPGLYRQLNQEYFQRVEAMHYTVTHDDGRNPGGLPEADIVLVGVSRVGKTPMSVYLALQGWKVANVPLVPAIAPPVELFAVTRTRVVGLTAAPGQLLAHRRQRAAHLGVATATAYTAAADLRREQQLVVELCREHGFALVDVTGKPVEESAYEVLNAVRPGPADPG